MAPIDHSAILRVSADDGLESITLRSDLAARYTFLNETLLEALGAVAAPPATGTALTLNDVMDTAGDDDDEDDEALLRRWEARLREEVAALEQQQQQQQ